MSRFHHSTGAALLIVATACSPSPPQALSPPPAKPANVATGSSSVAPQPALVEVRPLTISFRGKTIARMFANGRTESAGPNAPGTILLPGPTFHTDGTITLTKGGLTARLDASGAVYVVDATGATPREELFGHITGDRFTFEGSKRPWTVRVEDDQIWFGEHDSSQIDGVVTPAVRHTALVMAAAFYIEGALPAR